MFRVYLYLVWLDVGQLVRTDEFALALWTAKIDYWLVVNYLMDGFEMYKIIHVRASSHLAGQTERPNPNSSPEVKTEVH